jgi:AraC-like DNA-binding protein
MPDCLYQPFPMHGATRGQIWRYAPQYRRPRHFHAEPELNLIMAGTGRFGSGSAVIDAGPGDVVYWPPGCDHVLLEASPGFDLYVVGVTLDMSDVVLGPERSRQLAGQHRVQLPAREFSQLRSLCAVPAVGLEPSVMEHHMGQLWRAAHDARAKITGRQRDLGQRALESLLEQPELGRADRARLVHAHPTELSRYFHRKAGLTLTRYRTRLRLLRLIEIVDAGGSSLLGAALEAGFGSYSQFHRAFHQVFGCGPRRFFSGGVRYEIAETFAPGFDARDL